METKYISDEEHKKNLKEIKKIKSTMGFKKRMRAFNKHIEEMLLKNENKKETSK